VWQGPTFLIGGQSFSNVNDALTNLDQRTSANTTALTSIGATVSEIQSTPPASPDANSVAPGAGAVANHENMVSAGSEGDERVITNVADPVQSMDVVNKRTLDFASEAAARYTDQRFDQLQNTLGTTAREAYSGVAAATALAMLPDVEPGKSLAVGVSGAQYKGYAASALGVSARVRQNWKVRLGVGVSSSGNTYGAGAAYQW
jgi:autotransporter adhesin